VQEKELRVIARFDRDGVQRLPLHSAAGTTRINLEKDILQAEAAHADTLNQLC
jgi:hypothetical protein